MDLPFTHTYPAGALQVFAGIFIEGKCNYRGEGETTEHVVALSCEVERR